MLGAALLVAAAVAPAGMAHRGAAPKRPAPAGGSQGHRPHRLAWGRYTVVVEWVIRDPDSPPENYQQLRIVDARGRTVRMFRGFRIFDVRVVRLLGDANGELWFQASAGGHNGEGICGAYTQAGGLHNILFARDVLAATPVVGQGVPQLLVRQGLDGPSLDVHHYPEVTLVYCWDGRRFTGATARHPGAALGEAAKARGALVRDGHAPADQAETSIALRDVLQYLADMTAAGRKAEGVSWLAAHAPPFVRDWMAANRPTIAGNERAIRRMQGPLPFENGRVIDDVN